MGKIENQQLKLSIDRAGEESRMLAQRSSQSFEIQMAETVDALTLHAQSRESQLYEQFKMRLAEREEIDSELEMTKAELAELKLKLSRDTTPDTNATVDATSHTLWRARAEQLEMLQVEHEAMHAKIKQ